MKSTKQKFLGLVALNLVGIASLAQPVLRVPSIETGTFTGHSIEATEYIELLPGFDVNLASDITKAYSYSIGSGGCLTTPTEDITKNWTREKSYDLDGNLISDATVYSDYFGRPIQAQSKNIQENTIFVTETIYDGLGQAVLSTLPAPSLYCDFAYIPDFTQNTNGVKYSPIDFDKPITSSNLLGEVFNPVAVGKATGTGWYYSLNNSKEPNTPAVDFPYMRSFSVFPEVVTSGGPDFNQNFKTGKQKVVAALPVHNELNHYASKSSYYSSLARMIPNNLNSSSYYKTVSRNEDNIEEVAFYDQEGNLVATAVVSSTASPVSSTVFINSSTYQDIHLTANNRPSLQITGHTSLAITDLETGKVYTSVASLPTAPSAYYRITGTTTSSILITYNLTYSNFTYNYYDEAGRLIATVAPKYTKVGLEEAVTSTFTYNSLSQVLRSSSPDEGTIEIVYRKDGQVRFSRNSKQEAEAQLVNVGGIMYGNIFSYVNYDRFGTAVEAGEYRGTAGTGQYFLFQTQNRTTATATTTYRSVLEIVESIVTDPASSNLDLTARGVERHYSHVAVTEPTTPVLTRGAFTYQQRNVAGGFSSTQNANAQTWYSYDQYGRLEWTVQNLPTLGYKTIEYVYEDGKGNLLQTIYQKGQSDQFYHYYSYDVNGRLAKVETSLDGVAKQVEATYSYYLHGPLKREALANNLQGIDYYYTINGSLKGINHFDRSANGLDPGQDGVAGSAFAPDVFGMVMHYNNNDYTSRYYQKLGFTTQTFVSAPSVPTYRSGLPYAISWKNGGNTALGSNKAETMFYQYDQLLRLTDAQYARLTASTSNPGNLTYTYTVSALANTLTENGITYDENGRLKTLNRYSPNGNKAYTYTAPAGKNMVTNITGFGTMAYDVLGQMTSCTKASITETFTYSAVGSITQYTRPGTGMATYSYDEGGNKYSEARKNASNQDIGSTFYVYDAGGSLISIYNRTPAGVITQDEIPVYGLGRIAIASRNTTATGRVFDYQYEIKDHLNSVRVRIKRDKDANGNAQILSWADYYPYGNVMQGSSPNARFGFQGEYAEKNGMSDLHDFELRSYNAEIGLWTTPDPYGQFHSPYVGMGNNPHLGTDPDGGWVHTAVMGAVAGGMLGFALSDGDWRYAALGAVVGGAVGALSFGSAPELQKAGSLADKYLVQVGTKPVVNSFGKYALNAVSGLSYIASSGPPNEGNPKSGPTPNSYGKTWGEVFTNPNLYWDILFKEGEFKPNPNNVSGTVPNIPITPNGAIGISRSILSSWRNVNFRSTAASIRYHLAKHGNGVSVEKYTNDAVDLYNKFKHLGKRIILKDGTVGIKIKISSGEFGIYDSAGKIVTFGYK